MAHQTVAPIERLGVDAVHVPHQAREIGVARMQNQMEMIAHLALRQDLRVETIHRLREHIELRRPVDFVVIDGSRRSPREVT